METRVCRLHSQGDIHIETIPLAAPGPGEVVIGVGAGGICGSDIHYFQDGGIGTIRVREPIILGHEAAGTVLELGEGLEGLAVGDKVALNPSHPCGTCKYCKEGLFVHCLNMRFKGSAMRMPHEQGLFRDRLPYLASQCVKVAPDVTLAEAACSEPLAVCVHAVSRAGDLAGRAVLVTGAGPIGALCAALAAEAGAAEIVVTDLQDFPLSVAAKMGATETINVATDPAALDRFAADKGHFDVCLECTAAAPAIRSAIECLRPQGTLVQVGVAGEVPVSINMLVAKEITLRGTHRFHEEFAMAVDKINRRSIDVRPIVTQSFDMADAQAAFGIAGDRSAAVKVQLSFA
ncbi:L-idonate 5-dehydrogenase [Tropicimonas isoalkanivorans]|uniref:L-idonate 5-dehydrogenase n=1 Tax=Tropicimonas isoalkanivorans TaxID=441112 RepID=A0A1I1IV88_9RHOB|nr:L-idonate 5-dehydrogenase [Tropicimonas isoalkanivorans]SFC40085.1 L-idonate 5-dehydrogenase [Tropicimonas isoalkanivorans]